MDIFGFYKPTAGQKIRIGEFIGMNIDGICREFLPFMNVDFIRIPEKEFVAGMGQEAVLGIIYETKGITTRTASGETLTSMNCFVMNEEILERQFSDSLTRTGFIHASEGLIQKALMCRLWSTVFKSVRQVLRAHLIPKDQGLPYTVFNDLAAINTDEAQMLKKFKALGESTPELQQYAALEFDVYLIGRLALMSSISKEVLENHTPLNYDEAKRILGLTKDTLRPMDLEVLRKK